MPSPTHQLLAWGVPKLRKSRELDTEEAERARVERWHAGLDRTLPTRIVPFFARRYDVTTETLTGPAGDFPSHVVTPRGITPERTVVWVHGGGFMAPIDPFHVRYVARLARALRARIVLPDYPLAPEHTWRDSHDALVDLAARWCADGPVVLGGDSAGGGLAMAIALALRDRGGPQPERMLLLSPWIDLTTSAPDTAAFAERDPWLFLGKLHAYASWWAGRDEDLGRPEVSPGLAPLDGLPPALMFCGTRDLLAPGVRMLADRALSSTWELTYVEAPDLIHVYPLLPLVPEARRAWKQTLEFLR
ncbi:acetyl esterase/lipase [Nocardioides ginsengisegetis]|uniref:Acetyl esterase/lipase n=1 Tax=Nocardioides ginsengisegetis TaxID=661491 RepID=A0A7W3J340_9ACTN|nr:alpha/beta hydrolase [Nocardioides ginsengisegetis]MBA8805239.1 acetyl esterase/lipase [Nocardioides ginsengisegetis]